MTRKIDATDGTTYLYEFGDGKKVRLAAGKDGVTEEMICQLKRMDNRQYEKELDAAGRKLNEEEKKHWKAEHPGEGVPRIWNRSLDLPDKDGDSFIEQVVYKEGVNPEEISPEIERLYELLDEMPARRKEVLSLLFAGYTQSEMPENSVFLHRQFGTIWKQRKNLSKKISEDPQNIEKSPLTQ